MIRKISNNSAFSLIEVVVVIGIVVVGMLGVSSLMLQNLHAENIDRDFLISSMLAQEGLELVRNQRDVNWLTGGADWHEEIVQDGEYGIDYYPPDAVGNTINIVDAYDTIDDARLMIDDFGYYAHAITGGTDTEFYRLVTIDSSHLVDGYLVVTCTVRFYRLGQPKDYIAVTRLYSWRY